MIDPLRTLLHEVLREARVRAEIADARVRDRDGSVAEIRRARGWTVVRRQGRIEVDDVVRVAETRLVDLVRAEVADERRHEGVRLCLGIGAAVEGVEPTHALRFLLVTVEAVPGVEQVAVVEAVVDLEEALPLPLRRREGARRQNRRDDDLVVYVGVLVVGEVVRAISPDGPSNGAAVLIALLGRFRAGQQVSGHPGARQPEAVDAAVEGVGSALGDHADSARTGLPGLRLEPVRDDLQLLDHVERQAVAATELTVECPDLAAGHRHAVGDEVGHTDTLAVDGDGAAPPAGGDDAP